MSLAVLGAGAFGTALAVALSAKGPVTLWGRRIDWRAENPLLPGVTTTRAGSRSTPYQRRYRSAIPCRRAGRPRATV